MTDATGRSFLSYRRTRADEAALLIAAQHDHGIPTWHDRKDLAETPTGDELHRILTDQCTANALLWITPDVKHSDVIRRIEVPGILKRANNEDGFFLVPVCAGGIDYAGAADAVDQQLSSDNLKDWNLPKVTGNPISQAEAASVAQRVLKRRIEAIHRQVETNLPLKIQLNTRTPPGCQSGVALSLDWSDRFTGREAAPEVWRDNLLPALAEVASVIRTSGGGRAVVAGGLAAIPAATALGAAFLAQGKQKIAWSQYTHGRPEQLWSLETPRENSGFTFATKERDVSAKELAVLVSVAENVEPAFAQTQGSLPAIRAITHVRHREEGRFDIASPGQATDIAMTVIKAIRAAREQHRPMETVHLFMAVPLGVAMLIGQLLNTLGAVQTYEHIPVDGVGIYRPGALLHPSA